MGAIVGLGGGRRGGSWRRRLLPAPAALSLLLAVTATARPERRRAAVHHGKAPGGPAGRGAEPRRAERPQGYARVSGRERVHEPGTGSEGGLRTARLLFSSILRSFQLEVRGEEVSSVPAETVRRCWRELRCCSPAGTQPATCAKGQLPEVPTLRDRRVRHDPKRPGDEQRPRFPDVQPFLGTALHPKRLHLRGSVWQLLTQPSAPTV